MALLCSPGAQPIQAEFGPANLRLLTDSELVERFAQIGSSVKTGQSLIGIAIGMAGARTEADRNRIRTAAAKIWPQVPCYATNDLETALTAAPSHARNRILILSGTGSCCFGRSQKGKTLRFGGWGHFLGDCGSGYDIGLTALKSVVHQLDLDGKFPFLGQNILRSLQLNTPDSLIDWVKNAAKTEIAALAIHVFQAAEQGDPLAAGILAKAARGLADDGHACARRLCANASAVEFVLSGGLLQKQPLFARQVASNLKKRQPKAIVTVLNRGSVWGAVELAKKHFGNARAMAQSASLPAIAKPSHADAIPVSLALSPTEQRNPRSAHLDKLSIAQGVDLMISEDATIASALDKEKKQIEKAVALVSGALKKGGRLFYVGAGSSGRLGILDASEIPPTFRADPQTVQGIIAGGQTAIWKAVEGAEDDFAAGGESIQFRGVTKKDVVMGIAASGRTPFVWGALSRAKSQGTPTILLCFNPHLKFTKANRPDVVIAPNVGPEILTGSTRLKSGTATKMVLNMITTLAMVRLGKVIDNLMVDLNASNIKLRDRAVRMVCEITGADADKAEAALKDAQWIVKAACKRLRG